MHMTTQTLGPACDAYHGGLIPPEADIDFGRYVRVAGIPGEVRYLCDPHGKGLKGSRDPKYRLTPHPDRTDALMTDAPMGRDPQ